MQRASTGCHAMAISSSSKGRVIVLQSLCGVRHRRGAEHYTHRRIAVGIGTQGTAATIHQGSSRWPLTVWRKAAAGAPSITRWSKVRLRNIIDRLVISPW